MYNILINKNATSCWVYYAVVVRITLQFFGLFIWSFFCVSLKRKVVQRPKVKDTWQVFCRMFWRTQCQFLSHCPLAIEFERTFSRKWTKQLSVPFRVSNKTVMIWNPNKCINDWQILLLLACFSKLTETRFHTFVCFPLLLNLFRLFKTHFRRFFFHSFEIT